MNGVEISVTFPRFSVMSFMRAFLLVFICFPLFSIAQQSVLDGIYVKTPYYQEQFGKDGTQIGGELKMSSGDLVDYKPIKVNGFQFLNSSNYFPKTVSFDERSTENQAFNSYLYTQPNINLIGIANNGSVKIKQDYLIENNSNFYFKQHEVTNAEYREFVNYVLDSLALSLLAEDEPSRFLINEAEKNQRLNWENYSKDLFQNEDFEEVLGNLFYGENDERFYKRKQFDSRKFNYEYWDKDSARYVCNIYPDTLKWVHNLNQDMMEPNTQMYFWHPVYDDFPVVGLSYNQIQAYLHWRFAQGFKALDKKGIKYEIGLPTPLEWEFTTSTMYGIDEKRKDSFVTKDLNQFFDKSITLDLVLKHHPKYKPHAINDDDVVYYANYAKEIKTQFTDPYFSSFDESYNDGSVITQKVNWENEKIPGYNAAKSKVFHLGTNVSEWLDASFEDYSDYLTLKAKTLMLSQDEDIIKLGTDLMGKINSFSDSTHQLIMGANWMNERPEMFYGAPLKALYPKTFASRDSSYSTVGFRYVIRVKTKAPKMLDTSFEKTSSLDIFKELKNAGFILKTDTSESAIKDLRILNFKHDKSLSNYLSNWDTIIDSNKTVIYGVYIRAHSGKHSIEETKTWLKEDYPNIYKAIKNSGGKVESFYSCVPNQPANLKFEYFIRKLNSKELELILW